MDKTEMQAASNAAVKAVVKLAERCASQKPLDTWDRAYFRGQLAAIESHFTPDIEVYLAAMKALDVLYSFKSTDWSAS